MSSSTDAKTHLLVSALQDEIKHFQTNNNTVVHSHYTVDAIKNVIRFGRIEDRDFFFFITPVYSGNWILCDCCVIRQIVFNSTYIE